MESNRNTTIQVYGGEAYRGPQGLQGPVGPQGPKGDQGPVGPKGADGVNGKDGRDGVDGKDGQDGKGIKSVTLVNTKDKVKTYRIEYTDGTSFDFQVKDGEDGVGKGGMSGGAVLKGAEKTSRKSQDYNDNNAEHYPSSKALADAIAKLREEMGNTWQLEEMPEATADLLGTIVQYIGETDSSYTHGYVYECKSSSSYTGTIYFEQHKVGFDTDAGTVVGFFEDNNIDNYFNVTHGTMTYYVDGDIWALEGLDADNNVVFTGLQLYTQDLEDAGFVFLNPMTDFEDEEVIDFETTFTEVVSYFWERINVQPSSGGSGAVDDVEVNGVSVVTDGVASIDLTDYQEKATIQALSATDSITLADNTIYNGGEQTALTIALPATVDVSFLCEIDFTSGTTPSTLAYPNSIKWFGTDVSGGVFVPATSTRYTLLFYFDGVQYVCIVKGIV